jgi:hypothetical protein
MAADAGDPTVSAFVVALAAGCSPLSPAISGAWPTARPVRASHLLTVSSIIAVGATIVIGADLWERPRPQVSAREQVTAVQRRDRGYSDHRLARACISHSWSARLSAPYCLFAGRRSPRPALATSSTIRSVSPVSWNWRGSPRRWPRAAAPSAPAWKAMGRYVRPPTVNSPTKISRTEPAGTAVARWRRRP